MSKQMIDQFCKQVGKKLQCTSTTKQVLLHGLRNELSEFPNFKTASIASIEACIGSVDQVAEELQSTVSENESHRMATKRRNRGILIIGGVCVLALILVFLAYMLFLNGPFYTVESIKEIST